ncbi:MAG: DNA-binding protein [Planctomycetes bacterium]|nr:DNA-binding protein [Planctomycetota bacterium]
MTPPQYARCLGVKPDQVLAFIAAGELEAVNIAAPGAKRPRWRISCAAIASFEERRSSRTTATSKPQVNPRRKRPRRSSACESRWLRHFERL